MFKKFMRSQWRSYKQQLRRDFSRESNKKPTALQWIVVLLILGYFLQ